MTSIPKKLRIADPRVLEWARGRPCETCEMSPPSDPAHFKSRGAGGDDTYSNVLSLCRTCHGLQDSWGFGIKSFWKKFGEKIQSKRSLKGVPLVEVYWIEPEPVVEIPVKPKRKNAKVYYSQEE